MEIPPTITIRRAGGFGALLAGLILASCTGLPEPLPAERLPPEKVPERAAPSLVIASPGTRTEGQLAAFLRKGNPSVSEERAAEFARIYREEAAAEGSNHDIAFCQMLLETGFLKFGGTAKPEQNNFCGLGVTDSKTPGESFPTIRLGIRAHIQHLKAYGSKEPLRGDLVDRRFKYVRRGIAPTVDGLTGRWAADPAYGKKIGDLLRGLYAL